MTAAIIQARMGSTRFPGKNMVEILGIPVLQILVERLWQSRYLDTVIIAIPENKDSDVIEQYFCDIAPVFRGDEDNVLQRVIDCAEYFDVETIVDITADCPFISGELVDYVILSRKLARADYAANCIELTWPNGFDVQVYSLELLKAAAEKSTAHVGWNIANQGLGRQLHLPTPAGYKYDRLTLDTQDDLKLIRAIFEYFGHIEFPVEDVIRLLELKPELLEINKHVEQRCGN